jgi:hypothetical protein
MLFIKASEGTANRLKSLKRIEALLRTFSVFFSRA